LYCKKCGVQLGPWSKFCTSCGSPIEQDPYTAVSEYNAQETFKQPVNRAEVVWVLTALRKESFLKGKPCWIVFMKDKLIVAHLSAQHQKEENARMRSEMKAQGKGFFKSSREIMQYWADYPNKYYSMASEHILAEDFTNFAVQYEDIKKIVYRCEVIDIGSDSINWNHQGECNVSLFEGKKIKFSHTRSHNRATKEMLLELFGKKLKYRK
jgi:hypothetical protein